MEHESEAYDRITPGDAERMLLELNGTDIERHHGLADDILCKVLRYLGYGNVADAFDDVPKWYA